MFDSQGIARFVRSRATEAPERSDTRGGLRFSIVMPSFRHGEYIERSILSVLNQNYGATELIIIDGGSADATRSILERYRPELAFSCSEPDGGQSDALNKGLRLASGEIFGWLNSDDIYLPGAFEHVARIFAARRELEVIYGDWHSIDTQDRIIECHPALAPSRARLITEGFFCNAQAMFWRSCLQERVGYFDPQLHYTMDYDLMLRMISIAGRRAFFRTDRPLGCFRVHPGQKTGSSDVKVAAEHRHIAHRSGVAWKYAAQGRALRWLYRFDRAAQYLRHGGPGYVLSKLRGSVDLRPARDPRQT